MILVHAVRNSTLTKRDVRVSLSTEHAMPNPASAPLTFYPAYCFSLSPTHSTWARLTAAQVHTLREQKGFEGNIQYLLRSTAVHFAVQMSFNCAAINYVAKFD